MQITQDPRPDPVELARDELLDELLRANDTAFYLDASEAGWQSFNERDRREENEGYLASLWREVSRRGLLAC